MPVLTIKDVDDDDDDIFNYCSFLKYIKNSLFYFEQFQYLKLYGVKGFTSHVKQLRIRKVPIQNGILSYVALSIY